MDTKMYSEAMEQINKLSHKKVLTQKDHKLILELHRITGILPVFGTK